MSVAEASRNADYPSKSSHGCYNPHCTEGSKLADLDFRKVFVSKVFVTSGPQMSTPASLWKSKKLTGGAVSTTPPTRGSSGVERLRESIFLPPAGEESVFDREESVLDQGDSIFLPPGEEPVFDREESVLGESILPPGDFDREGSVLDRALQ